MGKSVRRRIVFEQERKERNARKSKNGPSISQKGKEKEKEKPVANKARTTCKCICCHKHNIPSKDKTLDTNAHGQEYRDAMKVYQAAKEEFLKEAKKTGRAHSNPASAQFFDILAKKAREEQ